MQPTKKSSSIYHVGPSEQSVPTPGYIVDWIREELFLLEEDNADRIFDPCPLDRPEGFDGLEVDWGFWCFVNPPYKNIGPWLQKGHAEIQKGKTVMAVYLIPFKPEAQYWHDFIWGCAQKVYIFTQPVRFGEHNRPMPHSMALVVFSGKPPPHRTPIEPLQIRGWSEHHYEKLKRRTGRRENPDHYIPHTILPSAETRLP